MFNLKLRKKPVEQNSENEKQEHPDDVPMPLTSHLGELRRRIVRVIIVIFVAFIGATVIDMELDQPILSAFRSPLDLRNVPLVFIQLTEPFFTYLRIGLYTSLFLTFPYLLGQIW